MSEPDEPTTAAEMALMEELKKLIEAADAAIDQEAAEHLRDDVVRMLIHLDNVIARAEEIAALRQAKGRTPLAADTGAMLAAIYGRAQLLRDQLEALHE